jgi:hypothetical protein
MNVNIKSKGKKMGRPAGRSGRPLQLYATDEFIASIDEWRRQQPDLPGRSEAIRRLVDEALGKGKKKPR